MNLLLSVSRLVILGSMFKYSRFYGSIMGWPGFRLWSSCETYACYFQLIPSISIFWRDFDGPFIGVIFKFGKWTACLRTIDEATFQDKLQKIEARKAAGKWV